MIILLFFFILKNQNGLTCFFSGKSNPNTLSNSVEMEGAETNDNF